MARQAKVKGYTSRDYRDCFLPRYVLDALGEPPHVRQGEFYVFETTAELAHQRAAKLGIKVASPRALRLADPDNPVYRALVAALAPEAGAVCAMPLTGNAVAQVAEHDGEPTANLVGEVQHQSTTWGFVPLRHAGTPEGFLSEARRLLCPSDVERSDADVLLDVLDVLSAVHERARRC